MKCYTKKVCIINIQYSIFYPRKSLFFGAEVWKGGGGAKSPTMSKTTLGTPTRCLKTRLTTLPFEVMVGDDSSLKRVKQTLRIILI